MSSRYCCAGFSISSSSHSSGAPSLPCSLPCALIAAARAVKRDHACSGASLGQWQGAGRGGGTLVVLANDCATFLAPQKKKLPQEYCGDDIQGESLELMVNNTTNNY